MNDCHAEWSRYHHHVSGLSSIKSTFDYGCGFKSHVEDYWKAKVIKVEFIGLGFDWLATLGDYDLDCKIGYGRTKDEAIEELLIALDDRRR